MDEVLLGCGLNFGTGQKDLSLCAPLQRLKEEHIPLWAAMNQFHATAERLIAGEMVNEAATLLYDQVADFTEQLKVHSRKEDEVLFPMMARYIGREVGPISVMEYEHKQAEHNLQRFLDTVIPNGREIRAEDISTIAGYALQAHAILTQHFSKEENVLFPMAEKMLSFEEKKQLDELILKM